MFPRAETRMLTGGVSSLVSATSRHQGPSASIIYTEAHNSLLLSKSNVGDTIPLPPHDWRLDLLLGDIVSEFNVVSRF